MQHAIINLVVVKRPIYIDGITVTPQVRHPERVFLREGSPKCGMI